MFKKRCSLCGGELVRGRCIECGLDNNKKRMNRAGDEMADTGAWSRSSDAFGQDQGASKWNDANDDAYRKTSKESISNEEFFANWKQEQQEMEMEDVYHRSEQIEYSMPKKNILEEFFKNIKKQPSYGPKAQPNSNRNAKKNTKKRSPLRTMILIFIFLTFFGNILGAVFTLIATIFNGVGDLATDVLVELNIEELAEVEEVAEVDEFIHTVDFSVVQEGIVSLEETGEEFDITLSAGFYEVGVHIPEGIYAITCINNGTIEVYDEANEIFTSVYFWDENIGETHTDIYLYQGAIVNLQSESYFTFETQNANYEDMEYMDNPNTDSYRLTTGVSVAGEDVPAGVYDFSMPEGSFSIVRVYESMDAYNDEDSYAYESMFMSNTTYDENDIYQMSTCSNMVIPEGYVIYVDNEDTYIEYLQITPSSIIKDENYVSVYSFNRY